MLYNILILKYCLTEDLVIANLQDITIIGVYLRPQTTVEKVVECIVKILELVDPATPTIMAGDFNCRLDKPDRKCQALLQLMEEGVFRSSTKSITPLL